MVRSDDKMKAESGAISTVDATLLLLAPKYHPEATCRTDRDRVGPVTGGMSSCLRVPPA